MTDQSVRMQVLQVLAAAMGGPGFAKRKATGDGYSPVKPFRKVGEKDLAGHLGGKGAVAGYPIAPGASVTRVAVLDFDDHAKDGVFDWARVCKAAKKVIKELGQHGLVPVVVRSSGGNGIHLWLLWTEALDASRVRAFLTEVVETCKLKVGESGGVAAGVVEIFPKQDSVEADGVASHITLPFSRASVALDPGTLEPVEAYFPAVHGPEPVRSFGVEEGVEGGGVGDDGGLAVVFNEGDVRAALACVDGGSREQRVFAGMCIRNSAADAGFSDAAAFSLWFQWVKESEPHHTEKKARDRWRTFKNKGSAGAKRRTLGSLYKLARDDGWDGPAVAEGSVIIMQAGTLLEIVRKAEEALIVAGYSIYQRGGELIMPDKGRPRDDSVRRDPEATSLFVINPDWLVQLMDHSSKWAKRNAKGALVPADPALKYAAALLSRPPSKWRFPRLLGVIQAPTLGRNGEIIETPGYDPGTELLLDFKPGDFPPVPENPSRADALAALEKLNWPMRKFPFEEEDEDNCTSSARSVALSAMLSALIRPSLRTVPLHGFDAPSAGTGKSILAEAAALLVSGTKPASMSQGKSSEEDEKRLSTVLHAGDAVIMIDNCQRQVTGDFLCSMLTQEKVQARILGQSERRVLPCTALVVCTGNNLTFAGDVSRRSVRCGMDAKQERPDQRKFDFDFQEEILANRAELVVAGLTVLRAYRLAGAAVELTPMGSFKDWAWVRGALVWLGHADPADTRERILEADPRRAELSDILMTWEKAYGDAAVMLSMIGQTNGGDDERAAVRAMLTELSGKPVWNARAVGWWLRRNSRRVIGGKCFVQHSSTHSGVSWQIVGVDQTVIAKMAEKPELDIPF